MLTVIDSDLTIYLAGPMAGIKDYNKEGFAEAKKTLADLGYDKIISPRDLGLPEGVKDPSKEADYMKLIKRDLCVMIEKCHWMILIPGWENSRGANLEIAVAKLLDIPVFRIEQLQWSRLDEQDYDSSFPWFVPTDGEHLL